MAAIRCTTVAAGFVLLLLLATVGDRKATASSLIETQNAYDSDLVFEDDGSPTKATLGQTKPLPLDEADRDRGGPLLSAVGADFEDSAEFWDDKPFARVSEDRHEAEADDEEELDEFDEDESDEDESANDVALPDDDDEEPGQGWLARSMKRIKRSLDNLWSGSGDAHGEHNETKHPTGKPKKGKKAGGKKQRKPKDKQRKLEQQQRKEERERKRQQAAAIGPLEAPTTRQRQRNGAGRPVANAIPAYLEGKSGGRYGMNRPKRQQDDGLEDIEGSGSGFGGEGSGDAGGKWALYDMTAVLEEPYHPDMRDPAKNGPYIKKAETAVKELFDAALHTDYTVSVKRLQSYASDPSLTFMLLRVSAPKDYDMNVLTDNLLNHVFYGNYKLRREGYSLSLLDEDAEPDVDEPLSKGDGLILDPIDPDRDSVDDEYGTDAPFESEEEATTTTPDVALGPGVSADLCRGDDKVPCGGTSVYICEVQQCDGHVDCPNGEDESAETCKNAGVCEANQLTCDGNKCIEQNQRCDGRPDCDDGQDEADCPADTECSFTKFRCSDGSCIDSMRLCDKVSDCPDGQDENDCAVDCDGTQEFHCRRDDNCISLSAQCDGVPDCSDGEDERFCDGKGHKARFCPLGKFTCGDRSCVSILGRCDGKVDCPRDQADEEDCPCPKATWQCDHGQCIPLEQKCDGNIDCPDDISDERNCPSTRNCTIHEFQCRLDKRCIPIAKRCDRTYDCHDYSDEKNCECLPDDFQCANGHCIRPWQRCDRIPHCNDRSDELNCDHLTPRCDEYEFTCRNGRCIPRDFTCNRRDDCGDDSDEENCAMCEEDEFTCDNGQCIKNHLRCDDTQDCEDGTDEIECNDGENQIDVKAGERCSENQFKCSDGICIADYKRCNGIVDCHDESDETGCNGDECSANEFACDGQCYEFRVYCNGIHDCSDDSDEQNCITCHGGAFHCKSNQCILPEYRCDGQVHCRDGSDEQDCNNDTRCRADEWQCRSGVCINSDFRCDGTYDCADNSDEEDCGEGPEDLRCGFEEVLCDNRCLEADRRCDGQQDCSDGQDELDCAPADPCTEHRCPDGSCFAYSQRCDGRRDCPDAYDEQGCRTCNETEFTCLDGHLCIDASLRCDSIYDCKDFSDEQNCFACRSNEFTCADGRCISQDLVCDRRPDCSDGSDERNCSCARNEFRCGTGQCIEEVRRCDHRIDCADGSDERDCRYVGCRPDEYQCSNGQCIRADQRCDRRYDCPDRDDEAGCHMCAPNEFRCENGPCIPMQYKCNGRVDCPFDTSDELDCETLPPQGQSRLNLRTYPDQQTIKESNEVVFQCRDEGPMHAKVKWVRADNKPLPPLTKDLNGRLEMPSIRVDHTGEYICEAVGYPSSTPGGRKSVSLIVERSWNIKYKNLKSAALKYGTVPHIGFKFFGTDSYQRPPTACATNEATCRNGECIAKSMICDGKRDCSDDSDEVNCSTRQCEPNEFRCRNRKCVLKTWLCDGEQDCDDGSDEENCATLPPNAPCRHDEYQCLSGQCIPKSFQCDTHPDCLDQSDEIGCMPPAVIQPPPPTQTIIAGGILNITCRATGVPVPLIVWRLNWGHVPAKCVSYSDQGFGRLVCEDMQPIDSGAYSCEIINSMGTHFVSPDTIVIVISSGQVCQQGYFNNKARNPADCINCFCFGVTTSCKSADLYTYALKPPVSSLTVVGIEGPWNGRRELLVGEFENHNLTAQRHGVQLRLTNLVPGRRIPYYSLPDEYKGNQLKSYGGSIRYDVEYDGNGRPIQAPDVILKGNGVTLFYWHSEMFYPDIKNHVAVSLLPGRWQRMDRTQATREDIMMLLASIESILIRMQYVDGVERNIELVNIMMDSAAYDDRGLGSASLVEECRCPPGYRGLSCESCDYDYVRQTGSGPWLGRCVKRVEECRPGYYGDPNRGIACKPCPCPVGGDRSRARTCYLDADDNVVCNCDRGYAGERCMECAPGYIGSALGEGCFPRPPTNCNSLGTERIEANGRCLCKQGVEGAYCDRCEAQHFYMHENGCVECFCMGVTDECSSTTWTREAVQASFADGRSGFSLISDYTNPSVVANTLAAANQEIVYRNFGASDDTFYWRLPTQFLGNKLTSYGGLLNYTLRYMPHSSGGLSRNNSPDVVLHSGNKIKLHHYRVNPISPIGSSTNAVPILEDHWQNYEDGNTVKREYLLMALANVSDIFIKATYNTVSNEAALSYVSLDIARDYPYPTGVRAWPVEQCQCPAGHIGLSCEDCAPGYYKGDQGLYLGLCERCSCNGHSDECDPLTGVCLNCRDNTYGPNCELCRPPYTGNATVGSPYDCTLSQPDQSFDCRECDARGSTGRCQRGCECKQLVEGYRCDQCREGSFGLSAQHDTGCLACFCSGVTKACGSSNLYREELPVLVDPFDNTIKLADRDGTVRVRGNSFDINPSVNEISYSFTDRDTYYWSLPEVVLGNQILSYGANLTVTQHVDGGRPLPDQDIILIGNGLQLVWNRRNYDDGTYSVPLLERDWTVINGRSSYAASRNDLLTVLSDLEHILIRATTKEGTRVSRLSDITLGTAVTTRTYYGIAEEVEMCRCPPGYRGTSCEQCEDLHYRDIYDRRQGMQGTCKPCPCENAKSCMMDGRGGVVCQCREGYEGENCEYAVRKKLPRPTTKRLPTKVNCSTQTFLYQNGRNYQKCDNDGVEIGVMLKQKQYDRRPVPPPQSPVISVVIDSPSLQIVEVGETYRADCRAHHIVSGNPIEVQWTREGGRLPERAYADRGTLVITNIQISDGGSYMCRAASGTDVIYKTVTINVTEHVPTRLTVHLSQPLLDQEEYSSAEVRCTGTGYPPPSLRWERLDQPMSYNAIADQGVLRFTSIRAYDAGTYECVGRNDFAENKTVLTVNVRPAGVPPPRPPIDSQEGIERVEIEPSSVDGRAGERIRLVCLCSPTARVTWAKLGEQRLPKNANVYNEILIIEHASQENSGRYTCTATFQTGRTKVQTVDVVIAPVDVAPPSNLQPPKLVKLNPIYVVQQGADFSLPCDATGLPFPTIQWTTMGNPLSGNVQLSGNVLRIFNAQPSNGGVYVCVATNEAGIVRAYVTLEIERREKPILQIHPTEQQTIKVGESVRFSCRASEGVPYPKITWVRKDRRPLSSRFVNDAEGVITLHEATLDDAGEYECRGENVAGAASLATTLEVLQPPMITLVPNEYHKITQNDDITITCTATGKPAPMVTLIPPQGATRENFFNQRTERLLEVTLQLRRAELEDAGTYECRAKNSAGEDSQYLTLQVDPKRGDLGPDADEKNPEPRPRPQPPRPRPPTSGYPDAEAPTYHTYKAVLGEQSQLRCNEEYLSARTQWVRRGGEPMPTNAYENGGNLTIDNTGYDAEGEYDCVTYPPGSSQPITIVRIFVQVIAPPKISFRPVMPMTVRPGDEVNIYCDTTGDRPINVRWHAEEGRSLPRSVYLRDSYLQFRSITVQDAGRYYCTASNVHGNTTKVAEVLVNNQELIPGMPRFGRRHYNISAHSSILLECKLPEGASYMVRNFSWRRLERPLPQRATVHDKSLHLLDVERDDEGTYECTMQYTNGTLAYDRVTLSIQDSASAQPILVPPRSYIRSGESIEVTCFFTNDTNVQTRWEKIDGTPLPYNIRQDGNKLYIQDAREVDAGVYRCSCYPESDVSFVSDFQLDVEENTIPVEPPRSSSRVEYAERGQTVRLQCSNEFQPTSAQWTRSDGVLANDRDTRSAVLTIPDVQASDAGTYVCSAKHGGQTVNVLITLVVNNVIPFFPQSPRSYIEYKAFENVYSKFYLEVSFKPNKMNGLILYSAQRRPNQDYIALSLRNGYPQFRFEFGGQQVMLQPEKPVRIGEWHTVKVNRVRNNGFLIVDDQTPVNFPDKLKFSGLSLDDHVFLGGVPNFEYVPASAVESREGFVGCISRLKLNEREVQLYEDALTKVGITSCEPCAEDPCQNAGICVEAQTTNGYKCMCREGFTGDHCQNEGAGCTVDTCGVGRCEDTDDGPECFCPVHKSGANCQYTEHYSDATLAFKDGSYAAYDKFQSKRSIRFRFKADSLENGVLLYAAEHEQTYGDFMAVILNNGFVELRYSVAGKIKPLVVRSRTPIQAGTWHMVSTGRSKVGVGYLQVDDEAVINEQTNRGTPIQLKTKVYAGGYDKRLLLSQEIGVRRGFEGCIGELEISGNKMNMIDDIRESANVYACGHETPVDSGYDEMRDSCPPGRGGPGCQIVTDICLEQRPCENGAQCETHSGGQNYTCTCQPGYLGLRCENVYNTLVASRFSGNGFIEINPEAIVKGEYQPTTELAIMFSAYDLNGLLLWYGQRNGEEFLGQDYIALAVQDGFAELRIRMDGEESSVRNSDVFVGDGERHVALISRDRNQFHLQVDSLTVHGETRPTKQQAIHIPGSIYIGGVPDIERVTGNRYNDSFNGCVFSVENNEHSKSIELRDYAIRTVNVDVCDDTDLGTEPPVV